MPQALHGQPERERKPEALPFHGPRTKTRSQRVTAIFMPPLTSPGLQKQIQACPATISASLTTQTAAHPQALKPLCIPVQTLGVRKPAGTEAAPQTTILCLER